MASCTQIASSLQAYIDGELGDSDRVILEQHVGECAACATSLRMQQRVNARIFEAFAVDRLRGSLRTRILENLPEIDPLPEDVSDVNWRAKHPAGWFSQASRFVPVAAAAMLVVVAFVLHHYWPGAEAQRDSIGVVTYAKGTVTRIPENSTHRASVELKSFVVPGDRFETAPSSASLLSILGPTHLKVNESTRIKLTDARRIRVEEGLIWVNVGHDGSLFKVVTPDATITVFGTVFSVEVLASKTIVTVESGLVQVENADRFCKLEAGQQVTLTVHGITDPIMCDVSALHAWANSIQPNDEAEAIFKDEVLPNAIATELPGKVVFLVDTTQGDRVWSVTAFRVYWHHDGITAGHSGYDVYVSNGKGEPLFKSRIEGTLFDDKALNYCEIPVPNAPIANVSSLLVRLVPDQSSGSFLNTSLDVKATAVSK